MKKIKILLLCISWIAMMSNCSISKNMDNNEYGVTLEQSGDADYLEDTDSDAPPMLSVHYYFERSLSKGEAEAYTQGINSIARVTSTLDLSYVPIDNFSSNFLKEGTDLYFIDRGIVAIFDDEENYYAALLTVGLT